jgi:hypothetical protein
VKTDDNDSTKTDGGTGEERMPPPSARLWLSFSSGAADTTWGGASRRDRACRAWSRVGLEATLSGDSLLLGQLLGAQAGNENVPPAIRQQDVVSISFCPSWSRSRRTNPAREEKGGPARFKLCIFQQNYELYNPELGA